MNLDYKILTLTCTTGLLQPNSAKMLKESGIVQIRRSADSASEGAAKSMIKDSERKRRRGQQRMQGRHGREPE